MSILVAVGTKPHTVNVIETAYDLATAYDDTLVGLHVVPEEGFDEHREHIMGLPVYDSFTFSHDEEGAKRFAGEALAKAVPDADDDRLDVDEDDAVRIEPGEHLDVTVEFDTFGIDPEDDIMHTLFINGDAEAGTS